jgi:hypothetical protein
MLERGLTFLKRGATFIAIVFLVVVYDPLSVLSHLGAPCFFRIKKSGTYS